MLTSTSIIAAADIIVKAVVREREDMQEKLKNALDAVKTKDDVNKRRGDGVKKRRGNDVRKRRDIAVRKRRGVVENEKYDDVKKQNNGNAIGKNVLHTMYRPFVPLAMFMLGTDHLVTIGTGEIEVDLVCMDAISSSCDNTSMYPHSAETLRALTAQRA